MNNQELGQIMLFFQDNKELIPEFLKSYYPLQKMDTLRIIDKKINKFKTKLENQDRSYLFFDADIDNASIKVLEDLKQELLK